MKTSRYLNCSFLLLFLLLLLLLLLLISAENSKTQSEKIRYETNISSELLRLHQRREDCILLVGLVPHPYSGGFPLFNSNGLLHSALDGVVFVK